MFAYQQPMTRRDAAEASNLAPLLTTHQAAAILGIGKRTLQELVAARKVACCRIGRSIRFHADDLASFIESTRQKAAGWKGGGR